MIYRIYKETGRIGTKLEKTNAESATAAAEIQEDSPNVNRISVALFDNESNTIHILNDKIIDVSSIVQKFKNHCDLPNNHQFSILHK